MMYSALCPENCIFLQKIAIIQKTYIRTKRIILTSIDRRIVTAQRTIVFDGPLDVRLEKSSSVIQLLKRAPATSGRFKVAGDINYENYQKDKGIQY